MPDSSFSLLSWLTALLFVAVLWPVVFIVLELALEVTTFEEGFDFLGVDFKEDSISYLWESKPVVIEGALREPWPTYAPTGYE